MSSQLSRRLFLLQTLLLFTACAAEETSNQELELVIGMISYGDGKQTLERFVRFREYLGAKTKAIIQLEPTLNENIALERIQRGAWSLVFAPPGLAAIASANYQYSPIFSLENQDYPQAIFVVREDSLLRKLKDLQGKTIALGQPGSATGYYFPLRNLSGFTLTEILSAPTPKTVLELVAQGKAAAGAISSTEYNFYKTKLGAAKFRILFTDSQNVPSGSVLIGPNVEINRQQLIRNYMKDAPPNIVQDVGYVPNAEPPDYKNMISLIKQLKPIAERLNSKPVRLF
ncbi:phosphonate ABC transporter substrate-binding protein [Brasilonema octagenarum UFV-E1]|uniref:Phosphonate ABC transporter substrate-binding protein n=1 Tax=Brasilonema sennae CENA114 TaxID=415709 RepID=A0A856MEI9_9CYAN|nr:PhnD/SsuA/transferrin family substrate-binding protein [Brasilonema sennae]QDL08734.1 phosphonate ABC transporter substrate-binding protein [Brasilonema sennae CENA114]QDL15091.1 phosphonate ABC transporter substrate-binding protein [Brasilonema octagenarum UFV-E1]